MAGASRARGARIPPRRPGRGGGGGRRYAAADEITRENVRALRVAWVQRHGDVSDGKGEVRSTTAFEATPILADGALFYCTPMNRVLALDARSGRELWAFDPRIDRSGRYANQLVCRGVETWLDASREAGGAG